MPKKVSDGFSVQMVPAPCTALVELHDLFCSDSERSVLIEWSHAVPIHPVRSLHSRQSRYVIALHPAVLRIFPVTLIHLFGVSAADLKDR